MTKRLDSNAGTVEFDNLIHAIDIPVKKQTLTIASGEGKLAKGTAIALNENGKGVILGTKKTAGYIEVDAKTAGALKVVASGAGTGEINAASVTPVVDSSYTPAANDYVLYQAADDYEANCILAEDIDATSADATAQVFVNGHFNKNKLTYKSGYTLTAAAREEFRALGILLSDIFEI